VPCSCDRRRGSRICILLTVGLQKQWVPITVALEQRHPCEPKSGLSLPQSYMFGLLRRFYLIVYHFVHVLSITVYVQRIPAVVSLLQERYKRPNCHIIRAYNR
jgi:hypothetical protein